MENNNNLGVVLKGEDWNITVRHDGKEVILHIPKKDLFALLGKLNTVIQDMGIESYIETTKEG